MTSMPKLLPSAYSVSQKAGRNPKNVSIAKAGAYAVGTNIIQVLGGLLVTVLMARMLGPAQKGVFDLYFASAMLLQFMLSFTLNSGITYVIASRPVNTPRLMLALALIAIGEAFVTVVIIYAAGSVDMRRTIIPSELASWGTAEVAATVFVLALSVLYRAALVGHREFIAANYADVWKQVLGVVLILVAIAVSRLTLMPLVHAIILANIITIFITSLNYGARMPFGVQKTRDTHLPTALRFALPSYLANASQYVNNRLDLFFVNRYWGFAHVGLYQTAVLIAQAINLLPVTMQGILFPTIASGHRSREEMADMIAQTHRIMFILSLFIAGTLAAAGPLLIPLMFGQRFAASAISLALLAPGCAVFVTTNIMAAYFAGTNRPHINFVNSLIGTVVTVILDVLVVPRWSFYGASLVTDLAYAVTTIRCLLLFQRETRKTLRELYVPTRGDLALARKFSLSFAARLRGRTA
jgi:O-antigen/teichoic acid export membrane protein